MNSLLRRSKFPSYVSSQTKSPFHHLNDSRTIHYDSIDSWRSKKEDYESIGNFSVATFNMLAPVYKRLTAYDLHTGGRKRESQFEDLWKSRATKTKKFFEEEFFKDVDIIALQEFWLNVKYLNIFREEFFKFGYQLYTLQRTGTKLDAVALVIKNKTFQVKKMENVFLCNMRDRVAIMAWLQHKATGKDIIVANTHLSFPHNNLESLSQVQQMEIITKVMDNFAHRCEISHATRLIMGDFNAEMKSKVCDHLKRLGFSSCFEISPPRNTTILEKDAGNPNPTTSKPSSSLPGGEDSSNDPPAFSAHSYQNQHYGVTTFVSHRNHLQEDVGVDHIFIRPETAETSTRPQSLVDWTMSASILDSDDQEDMKPEEFSYSPKEKVKEPPKTNQLENVKLFVDNCLVLPKQKPCHLWDEDFRISDHRPVIAKIVFGRKKKKL